MAYPYQGTNFFPQPQGNVFVINSSAEVSNIPASSNLSAILCPSEQLLFVKSIQNGAPSLLGFSLTPYELRQSSAQDSRVSALEQEVAELKKLIKGGRLNNEV